MSSSVVPVVDERFVNFMLFQVLDIGNQLLNKSDRFSQVGKDVIKEALDMSQRVAQDKFVNHNRANDLNEPTWKAGEKVNIIPQVADALTAFKETGLFAAHADFELGGMQFPSVVTNSLFLPFYSSNVGTMAYPFLTIAAGNMLREVGSEEQLKKYLIPMLEGRFFGTMNLSEPQAGSSLADITTKAFPLGDGRYSIKGTKMWISGGEHNLSENIVHMVLAKVCDPEHPDRTPPGVKGISLFIVPKYTVNSDGSIGDHNGIELAGLNHKMGWRGTTNCVLNYGEETDTIGELLGDEGRGLATMFLMMNEARISVGTMASALGYAGYAHSLAYAKDRKQGRVASNKQPTSDQVPIIRHPDVRRMLLAQKAYVEGSLSLCLYGSLLVDQISVDQCEDKALLLDTLTPIIKSWPSEWCLEANKWAIQIHGGYGYTRDYAPEQIYRDNRLNMIHEGTNGIQSLDLLGRKVHAKEGRGVELFIEAIQKSIDQAKKYESMSDHATALEDAISLFSTTTTTLRQVTCSDLMLCNSHEYLNMAGHIAIAWQWLEMERAATQALSSGADLDFYNGKLITSRYFFKHELPKVYHQADLLCALDDTNLLVHEQHF